jgi:hypothetical protein
MLRKDIIIKFIDIKFYELSEQARTQPREEVMKTYYAMYVLKELIKDFEKLNI